jgi:hypothetical protein
VWAFSIPPPSSHSWSQEESARTFPEAGRKWDFKEVGEIWEKSGGKVIG